MDRPRATGRRRRPTLRLPSFTVGVYGITSICGMLDAASYLGLGHVFVELMTGNMLYLAFTIGPIGASRHLPSTVTIGMAGPYMVALGVFAGGAVTGGRFVVLGRVGRPVGFAAEWALVGGAVIATLVLHPQATGDDRFVVICILAFAMGIQNGMIRRWGVVDLATNVMTLTFTALLADSTLGGGTNPRAARRGTSIAIFVVSAGVGAFLVRFGVLWPELAAFVLFTASLPMLVQLPPEVSGTGG